MPPILARAWIRRNLALAGAYFVAGRLALLLALPPGYAAPVWPAAGLGLVGVLAWGRGALPGLLLGSLAVNLWISFDASTLEATARSIAAGLAIAAGAAAQACLGAALIRRFVGWPTSMVRARDIGLLLLCGGPISCVLNALWSPFVLLLLGLLSAPQVPFSMFTWWVGDAIGVLMVVPLVAIWGSRERSPLRRRLFVSLPLAVSLALAVALFLVVTRNESQQIQFEFQKGASRIQQAVRDGIGSHLETLRSLRSLYYASEEVTPDELRIFVEPSLTRDDAIRAFSWSARVTDRERDAFEADARTTAGPGFKIWQHGPNETQVEAPRRTDHVVIRHIEPQQDNERALGFDMLSEPERATSLRVAAADGEPAATSTVALAQDPRGSFGILLLLPVYVGGRMPPEAGARWIQVRGFVAAILDAPRLLADALARAGPSGIAVELLDRSRTEHDRRLASSEPAGAEFGGTAPGLESTSDLAIAHWDWTLRYRSAARYVEDRWGWRPWAALAGGLLFSGLISAFLLVVTGRALLVEEQVRQRTEDLRLVQRDLLRRNEEIRTVYHTVSHELKTPLASTREFVAIVLDRIAGAVTAEQEEYLTLAKDGLDQMARLVDDLTDVARLETGKITLEVRPMAVGPLLEGVVASLRTLAREADLRVDVRVEPGCPDVLADERRLAQVVRNLLANAIKFTPGGGRIDLSAGRDPQAGAFVRIVVRDTGRGIAPEELERVFDRLYQVREGDVTSLTAGLGLGLHICRELVRLHGGRIWAESKVGEGSTFSFTLAAVRPPARAAGRPEDRNGGERDQEDPAHRG